MKTRKARYRIEDLKDDIPIRTLIEHLGGQVVGGGWGGWEAVRCPFTDDHRGGDRDASASINPVTGYFLCHACGAPRDGMAGDIIDVAKHHLQTASITEAIDWLRKEVA